MKRKRKRQSNVSSRAFQILACREKQRERPRVRVNDLAADVAAFDAMCSARPLTPPPMPRAPDTRSSGAIALAREIRRGYYRA